MSLLVHHLKKSQLQQLMNRYARGYTTRDTKSTLIRRIELHRVFTRWKKRRAGEQPPTKEILAVNLVIRCWNAHARWTRSFINDVDPITLQPFHEISPCTLFHLVHETRHVSRYSASSLLQYVERTGCTSDPITRRPLYSVELRRLYRLSDRAIPVGATASVVNDLRERRQQAVVRTELQQSFEDEIRVRLSRLFDLAAEVDRHEFHLHLLTRFCPDISSIMLNVLQVSEDGNDLTVFVAHLMRHLSLLADRSRTTDPARREIAVLVAYHIHATFSTLEQVTRHTN